MNTPNISTLRRRAAKLGYAIRKSRWRIDTIDNLGGYRIESGNTVVDGPNFDLSLEYVAAFLEREAAA